MSLHKYKRKLWLDNHSRKIQRLKTKTKQLKKQIGLKIYYLNNEIHIKSLAKTAPPEYINLEAPSTFSFKSACEDTSRFFQKIIDKRDSANTKTAFHIDFSKVSNLSVDALMYLIALMYDTYTCDKEDNIQFAGNFPENEDAFEIFKASGFTKYVKLRKSEIKPSSDNIQIANGTKTDSELVGKICEYIHNNSKLTRIDTIPLYNLIVELMNNTVHHAYGKDYSSNYSKNSWYLFSEKRQDSIVFVFLDTGLGIPSTVYKKWKEKINFTIQDSFLIKSALEGEERTQTKLKNRGRGLPQILECCKSGLIDNAYVYSGKGYCTINKTDKDEIKATEMKNSIFGTLFSWEVII